MAICHNKDGHTGNISLFGISFVNRNAEFALLICNRNHWGKAVYLGEGDDLLRHDFFKPYRKTRYLGPQSRRALRHFSLDPHELAELCQSSLTVWGPSATSITA